MNTEKSINVLKDIVRQRDDLRKIADNLIKSVECERALRLDEDFEVNTCKHCTSAIAAYWEEFHAR